MKLIIGWALGIFALGSPATGAEEIKLSCALDRGWKWNVTLDLEAMTLTFGQSNPVDIVELTEKWIVAQSSEAGESSSIGDFANAESWVINRFTGEFWSSDFGFFSSTPDAKYGGYTMQLYRGTCVRGF